MNYTNRPTLVQTEDEYLLFIHPAEKERAKVVSGYRWDPTRRCWVYPRLKRVHDALFAEFGDELDSSAQPDETAVEQMRRQFDQVTTEREQLRAEVERLKANIAELNAVSTTPQQELKKLRDSVSKRDALLAQQYQQVTALQSLVRSQQAELDNLRAELDRRGKDVSVETRIKYLALEATGSSEQYADLLDQLDLDETAPIKLAANLERKLRELLRHPPAERLDLFEMLVEARDTDALPQDAIDLAHIIRKQRNIVAHAENDESACQARAIICMFAMALLWPEFEQA